MFAMEVFGESERQRERGYGILGLRREKQASNKAKSAYMRPTNASIFIALLTLNTTHLESGGQ